MPSAALKGLKTSSEAGFTIVEVLVSLTMFSLVATSLVGSLIFLTRTNTNNEIRAGAMQAAQQVLDGLRATPISSLPGASGSTQQRTVSLPRFSFPFVVDVIFCKNAALCQVGTTRHIRVEVKYQDQTRFSSETVFTELD